MTPPSWQFGPRYLTLDRPRVMAILNLTPDSFSDGGRLPTVEAALGAARKAFHDGADLLDLGGESTRPGSQAVSAEEQTGRVVPVLNAIRSDPELRTIPVSIDTTRSSVARAALDAGADIINDTSAGRDDPEMLPLAAARSCGLILMHRLKRPFEDSYSDRYTAPPAYFDVVEFVKAFLSGQVREALATGVSANRIVLDPGLGFGKTVEQNLDLIRRSSEFASLGFPILSGASRKSFVGRASGMAESVPADRVAGSIAISVAHYHAGARIFRVHDVAPQVQALRVAAAISPPV